MPRSKKTTENIPSGLLSSPQQIVQFLDDNKAFDIITIPLNDKSIMADYLIVASGLSRQHLHSLADKIMELMPQGSVKRDGYGATDWIVLDNGSCMIHLFKPDVRLFYNDEAIWA